MNFYKMLDIIQSKNEGRIVLCDLGKRSIKYRIENPQVYYIK